jgi:hypothetical protein
MAEESFILQQIMGDFNTDFNEINLLYNKDFKINLKDNLLPRLNDLEKEYNQLNSIKLNEKLIGDFKDEIDKLISGIWIKFIEKHLYVIKGILKKRFYLNLSTIKVSYEKINSSIINEIGKLISLVDLKKIYYEEIKEINIKLSEEYKYFKIQIFISAFFSFLGAVIGVIISKLFF